MIDTHCHVDLFGDPIGTAKELDSELCSCVAVTMLPSHFKLAQQHLRGFCHVTPALGMHPLRAREAQKEIQLFKTLAPEASFVGEIGIDGSAEGRSTLGLQKEIFSEVVGLIPKGAFVTVHSRGAWRESFELLTSRGVGPVCFHYFTGGADAARVILDAGHYFSVNHRMIEPESRHRSIVAEFPCERVLVESDGPFLGPGNPIAGVKAVYAFFSAIWGTDVYKTCEIIRKNFSRCRTVRLAQTSTKQG